MKNTIVVGSQWGDEGKAKVIDVLAEHADVVIRFQGGANAGHTVVVGDQEFVFHLIPSAIMRPGKICVIGNGVVLDPAQLLSEIEELEGRGFEVRGRLFLAENMQIVMPWHVQLDQLKEKAAGKNAIGTTGRGIGPAYVDKVARCGIRLCDLLDPDNLQAKVESILEEKNVLFTKVYGGEPLQAAPIVATYLEFGRKLGPLVSNASLLLEKSIKAGKALLFEGAQGTILDVDHGSYPYVTSSNTIAGSACCGSGVGPTAIQSVIGVVKAYTTRVGNGPFPTELDGDLGTKLREWGGEFGATTGRPRRCGWFDAVVVRKAVRVNGITGLAITKLDVLDKLDEIRVCTGYTIDGQAIEDLPVQIRDFEKVQPVYETLSGWNSDTSKAQSWADLPATAKRYLERLAELSGAPIAMVSVGPRRDQAIFLP
ncbi:MAG TPA: adenylosuccinate synthase [Fibrobacteria bacterium]|nr:adenylosuccinate synthase [Fibrobacteria bacterium]